MTCMIQKILVTSISLLMIHTAKAQPISASSLTLEQGLSCLDWVEKEQSFNNQLVLGTEGYTNISYGQISETISDLDHVKDT
ncbi:hypothetical protein M2R48_14045 [Acinetobacter sp. I-MWF]|nr:hypothetical protein [Acinetobacter sp. I-MWF]